MSTELNGYTLLDEARKYVELYKTAKDAINFVLDRASLQHDDICFIVKIGTRNIPK